MGELVYHIPAMLTPTIEGLRINPDGVYVDVTLGGGGHSRAIHSKLSSQGRLFSFDQDWDAYANQLAAATEGNTFSLANQSNWQFVHGNFRHLKNFLRYYKVEGIDGLLADLGVSFHHFDEAERGFSFRYSSPLDMRMNQHGGKTAADIVNTYSEEELARVLYLYGELKNSRRIANTIVRTRSSHSLARTEDLVAIMTGKKSSTPLADGDEIEVDSRQKKDLARMFQALRIEVNDEMGALETMLTSALQMLKPQGRIAILTYHSLEDRIVKNFLRSGNCEGKIEKDFYGNILTPFRVIEKGRIADEEEVAVNPRARSAKLRVAERI